MGSVPVTPEKLGTSNFTSPSLGSHAVPGSRAWGTVNCVPVSSHLQLVFSSPFNGMEETPTTSPSKAVDQMSQGL